MLTIDNLLQLEKEARKSGNWFSFWQDVQNDNGLVVSVSIKSFGFYNQILRTNDDPINYCSGHTIDKVKAMHDHIRKVINSVIE